MRKQLLLVTGLLSITILCGTVLTSIRTVAETTKRDNFSLTIPTSCTMSGVGTSSHTASMSTDSYSAASGSPYENGIGKTTITTFCNDENGFSIYAVGYTGNTEGNNTLVGVNTNTNIINTGVHASTDTTSNWAMKITKVTDSSESYLPQNMSIQDNFDSWHAVPDTFAKVAQYHATTGSSVTDDLLGAKVETTYAAYIASDQAPDTYTGQVKYVLVHPYNGVSPDTDEYTTTVTLGTNITKITFTSDITEPQTVKSSGDTVSLYDGVTYTITATTADGYELAGWTTDQYGTIGNATQNPTTFTATGTTTLTATAQEQLPEHTCTKEYRLQNADGTYPATYTSDGTETLRQGSTCTYTKSVENYQTQEDTATMTTDQTISLDLPRNTYELTVNKDNTNITTVAGAGTYRWGETVNISATPATGSRFTTWTQTSGTTSTFADATSATTTFTMPTSAATITANGEPIPSHNVTVTLDSNTTSVSFYNATYGTQNITTSGDTASLRSGVEYTITATFASGYKLDDWTAGSGATIGSTTANPTTLVVTSAATLSASSKVDTPEPQPSTARCINYFANASDAVGTMGCQPASDGQTKDLLASNFSRTGYGFAGWSDSYDYATNPNAKFYGPMETITVPTGTTANGLSLYAVWIKSQGSIQDQSKVASVCNSLTTAPTDGTANLTSVSALTDQRDNNTYAIAKLADGNCWMIENLRLDSTAEHNSDGTLAQGYGTSATYGSFGGLADAESSNFLNSTTANNLYYSGTQSGTASINIGTTNYPDYRMPRYNNVNTSTRASNPTDNEGNMYSYGNYYTWHAAIANLTHNGTNNQSTTGTSLCPAGWHLPTGGRAYASDSTSGVNVTGDTSTFREFYDLGYKTMDEIKTAYEDTPNGGNAYYSSNTTNTAGKTATAAFRSFPNNFLYSGYFFSASAFNRGSFGYYWTSTAYDSRNSDSLSLNSSYVRPGTGNDYKYDGRSIRCTVGTSTPAPTTKTLTVSLDSNVTSVTFSDGMSPDQTVTTNGGTVNLTPNTSYTITATTASGYEFSSWTAGSGATLGSTTANPTTLTITGTTTLSVTSQQIPSYNVTVTLDSNTTSVSFTNATYGTQNITTSGSAASLRSGVEYTITATFASDYELASWTAGANATLGSTTTNPTTLTVTSATTLSASSHEVTQSSCATSPMISTVASGITYMQDINSGNKSTVLSALTQDATYQIKDNRDNETYCVGKLADGNLWLLDNLALDLTNNTVLSGMNESNTHASNTTLGYLKNGGGTASDQYAITGVVNWTDSPTYASSYSYSDPLVNLTNKDIVPTDATSQAGQYKVGGYYNYCAASAGSYCYGNGTSWGTSSGDATEDICPKGWRMPTGGSSGEYKVLYNNASYNTYANYRSALRFPLSGTFYSGSAGDQGSRGYFWSSTHNINNNMYYPRLNTSNINPVNFGYRYYGNSVRCVLDPVPTTETLTVSLDSNVTSVTFSDGTNPDQTVTTNGGTVNLTPNTSYTITATTASGYEFSSWTPGSGATLGSTTANPTTITITGATTLGVTSQQIPSYNVTVTLDTNITSVSFTNATYGTQNITTSGDTASLRSGVEYIITATTASGYEFNSWTAGANATIGSTTTNPTTLTVTAPTTLSATSRAEGASPQPSTAGCINYFANASNAVGTMGCQSATDGQSKTLLASNFSRTGYGFAGWSDSFDYTTNSNAKFYGPNETITVPTGTTANGLSLYAVWIKSQGNLQDTTKVASVCSGLDVAPTDGTANLKSVSALTDQRDNNTYAIAKLADGKCWMIENLRLESTNSDNTTGALAQGYGTSATYGNFGGLADVESTNFSNSTTANSLYYSGTQEGIASIDIGTSDDPAYRMPRYNNTNTSTRASNPTSNIDNNMYSYGNYYTWHAAIADLTYNGTNNQSTTGTSLCPTGWHLPKGGDKSNEANNEFWSLVVGGINGNTKPYDSSTTPYYTGTPEGSDASKKLRAYPNNFLYSGGFNASSALDRGRNGIYWSSTAYSNYSSYYLYLNSSYVYPGTNRYNKIYGYSIRCTVGSSTPAPTTETLTVTLDSNVTSVTFSDGTNPDQTVTTNGGTVNLTPNTSYTVTATTASGYELASWTAGSGATLGSTTANPTTLTITSATTLSVTSQSTASLSACAGASSFPGVTYMQDLTTSDTNNLPTETVYTIKDKRDEQTYCISKLRDGKVWMTENLNLAGGTALSADDTDVTSEYIASYTAGDSRLAKSGDTLVLPASDTAGFNTNNYSYVYNSGNKTDCGASGQNTPCYSYYSWDAATLGSGRTIATENTDAPYSICPKGWRLPTSGNQSNNEWKRGDFYKLAKAYGANLESNYYENSSTFYNNAGPGTTPNFLLAGSYIYGLFYDGGSNGYYWGSTSYSNTSSARNLYFYSSKVYPAGSNNRGLGFSVRCLFSTPTTSPVTVNLDSNVTSVSFTNATYGTQNVTTSGSTVNLYPNTEYTITATTATGYEFSSWTAGSGATLGSTTTNPTTLTITSATTLSVTSQQIPSYNVTVTLDSNTTSVSFTNATYGTQNITTSGSVASLRSGVEYIITATTASGYEFSSWTAGSGATLGSTTTNPTTLTVTAPTTLSATSREEGTGPQPSTARCINYFANASDAVGTMGCQSKSSEDGGSTYHTITDGGSATLLASNFSRTGYGFAGWSDSYDYATNPNAKFYGPQETITVPTGTTANGLSLYAVWIKSQGSIQDQSKVASVCSGLDVAPTDGTANLKSVSALTDQRDNNTYAIAKLADGNCWMIENLRLESTNSDNSTGNLAQGYGGQFAGLADAEPAWTTSTTTANSLYSANGADSTINIGRSNVNIRFPRYNHDNTNSRASTPTYNIEAMYSYGNYYTWAAAIADTTSYSSGDHNTTSICPTGWQLPLGNTSTGDIEQGAADATNKVGGFSYLDRKMGGTGARQSTADDSLRWRKYPVNFVYSGWVFSDSVGSRGSYGHYCSSTVYSSNNGNAYDLGLGSSVVRPGIDYYSKSIGKAVRCVAPGV